MYLVIARRAAGSEMKGVEWYFLVCVIYMYMDSLQAQHRAKPNFEGHTIIFVRVRNNYIQY